VRYTRRTCDLYSVALLTNGLNVVGSPLPMQCVATGATLCYLISAALGPALLAVPSWRARLDAWTEKIDAQRDNLMSYLIVIR
jgi:hypothetical protein